MMKYPWSSSGTNPVGTRVNTKNVSPSPARKISAATILKFRKNRRARRYPFVVPAITLSTSRNSQIFSPCSRPNNKADSAGVSVSALNAEIVIENAIVSANCRNRMPVVPGKNATGTNTATNTRDVAITAPVTSPIASDAAWCASRWPS